MSTTSQKKYCTAYSKREPFQVTEGKKNQKKAKYFFSTSVFKLDHATSLLKTPQWIPTAFRINVNKSSTWPVAPFYLSIFIYLYCISYRYTRLLPVSQIGLVFPATGPLNLHSPYLKFLFFPLRWLLDIL